MLHEDSGHFLNNWVIISFSRTLLHGISYSHGCKRINGSDAHYFTSQSMKSYPPPPPPWKRNSLGNITLQVRSPESLLLCAYTKMYSLKLSVLESHSTAPSCYSSFTLHSRTPHRPYRPEEWLTGQQFEVRVYIPVTERWKCSGNMTRYSPMH